MGADIRYSTPSREVYRNVAQAICREDIGTRSCCTQVLSAEALSKALFNHFNLIWSHYILAPWVSVFYSLPNNSTRFMFSSSSPALYVGTS